MTRRRLLMSALALALLLVGWVALNDDPAGGDGSAEPPQRRAAASARVADGVPSAAATRRTRAASLEDERALSAAWPRSPADAVRAAWPTASAPALLAWGAPPQADPSSASKPPAPAAPDEPPPAPQAPPLPYTLIGRLDDGGQVMALLAGPTRTLSARSGDVLDGQWRIDSIQPNAVTLTWLPANVIQILAYRPS